MTGQVTDDIKASLVFLNYNVEEVKFSLNTSFKEKESIKINFQIESQIYYMGEQEDNNENKKAVVVLNVNIFQNAVENNYPFSLYIRLAGFFEVDNYNSKNLLETNAVAILFPYVRSLVTTITANSNVNPLILPPVNVIKLMEKKNKLKVNQKPNV